jgi:Bacterial regulatory helix-turn-helix protein, lysR family
MTLAELQYIVAVAQERHFGRAASRVFVTPPALSLAGKKLEDDLGTTIFECRIGLAWRRGFTRPQIIDVIRGAVQTLTVPGLKMARQCRP